MSFKKERLPEVVYRKHPIFSSGEPSPWVRQPTRQFPLFCVLVACSCGLITIDHQYGFGWVLSGVQRFSDPIIYVVDLALSPVSRSASSVRDLFTARTENQQLREQLGQLQLRLNQLEEAYYENSRLRELLNLKAEFAPTATAVRVLTVRQAATHQTMILKAGQRQGLMVGQMVLTHGGQLLGHLKRVGQMVAEVQLITDPFSAIGVTVLRTQAQGILFSYNGELFVRLDRNEHVTENDLLVTSHLSDIYDPGYHVGKLAGRAPKQIRDPMIAAQLGLNTSYHVNPLHPSSKWKSLREVLVLPVLSHHLFSTQTGLPLPDGEF